MTTKTNGLLFVLSAPSGCGKDALLAEVESRRCDDIVRAVSATTRPRAATEADGVDYHYVTRERFEQMIANGELIEYASYNGNYYGSVKANVDRLLAAGKNVVLKIDVQGAKILRERGLHFTSVFLLPPSRAELRRRQQKRDRDSAAEIDARMAIAESELTLAPQYDYLIVNDDISVAADELITVIRAQRYRRANMLKIWEEVMHDAQI